MSVKGSLRGADLLAARLAAGDTVAGAAKAAGVSERTAYRRIGEPDFQAEVTRLRAELWERTAALLAASGARAVTTLVDLLAEDSPPPQRLGAARAIIEMGARLREAGEIEERLRKLEESSAAQQQQKGGAGWGM